MEHIRIIKPKSNASVSLPAPPLFYFTLISAIDEWWKTFFDSSISKLLDDDKSFFSLNSGSPFPIIAHVTPLQDACDSKLFIEALKSLGIPFIDKKIHHIQMNEMILFHPSSPPSDVPRVMQFFYCFDPDELFGSFIDRLLVTFFKFGITPNQDFIMEINDLYFDKYCSFTYLMVLIKQSLFDFVMNSNQEELNKILYFDEKPCAKNILNGRVHSEQLPSTALIKMREKVMILTKQLFMKYNLGSTLFDQMDTFEDFWKSKKYMNLLNKIKETDDDEIYQFFISNSGYFSTLFNKFEKNDNEVKNDTKPRSIRTRRGRQMALLNQVEVKKPNVNTFETILSKVFRNPPKNSPNVFSLCKMAHFNPRESMKEMLTDEDSNYDTANAYQILLEQDKIVSISKWLKAFSAKIKEKNKAIALSRFQVAVSDLEYLGIIDKNSRKPGTFRRILHV